MTDVNDQIIRLQNLAAGASITEDDLKDIQTLLKSVRDLQAEKVVLQQVAAFLAECHAANVHDVEAKSVPKTKKERYRSIMLKAAGMLKGKDLPPRFSSSPAAAEDAIKRAVERLESHADLVFASSEKK